MIRSLVRTTGVLTGGIVAAGVLGVTAAPAVAAPAAPAAQAAPAAPGSRLVVSIIAEAGWARAVTLECSPPGGGHPKAAKACAALKGAGGKPNRLKRHDGACTTEYAPVTAAIDGRWKGRTVRWTRHFGNVCELTRAAGVVVTF